MLLCVNQKYALGPVPMGASFAKSVMLKNVTKNWQTHMQCLFPGISL